MVQLHGKVGWRRTKSVDRNLGNGSSIPEQVPCCQFEGSSEHGSGVLQRASGSPSGSGSGSPSGSASSGCALPLSRLLNSLSITPNHMGPRSNQERGSKGQSLMSGRLRESVVSQVIDRVRLFGFSEDVCKDLRAHFSRLPVRYALTIDVQRHEDVMLHMRLLQEAWEAENDEDVHLPQLHVRKVQLGGGSFMAEGSEEASQPEVTSKRRGIPIPKIPKPAFGSCSNLAGLLGGSQSKVHPAGSHNRSRSSRGTPPGSASPISRPTFGSLTNSFDVDDDGYSSGHEESSPSCGFEITLATSDRHGILKRFTSALNKLSLQLNIKEAHVFSTTDGMALQVFVVEGWTGDEPEELRQAFQKALSSELSLASPLHAAATEAQLRKAAEAIAYEDWAVDFKNLVVGERLGGGSSGRLYRGTYLSQDVAIKMMLLDVAVDGESGTLIPAPAAELLQMFKQEVAIMRLVRHKNLVQFIGACSSWPKLCIVTELMAGGSVRDVMQVRGSGLEFPAAVKVLRDAAKGMDFLHRRGIVHRDLKAANLLIDEHDVVKVCDFGVARLKPSAVGPSGSGNWPEEMTAETGTYRWMSPEVLEHKPYDHKADVYSFGIMIWEVVTGEVPYSGLSPLQAAMGVVQRQLRPVMPPLVPEKLTALAERCWHQDPKHRPEFSEVLCVLEDILKPAASASWKKGLFGKKKMSSHHYV